MYEAELKIVNDTPPLDLNFDLLCDAKTYKVSQSLIAGASDHNNNIAEDCPQSSATV